MFLASNVGEIPTDGQRYQIERHKNQVAAGSVRKHVKVVAKNPAFVSAIRDAFGKVRAEQTLASAKVNTRSHNSRQHASKGSSVPTQPLVGSLLGVTGCGDRIHGDSN